MKTEKNPITRRESLKRMGGLLAGIALGTSTLSTLSSCAGEKKRLIFFFSATGNSLYIARQVGGELLSIPQVMQGDQWEFEADEIGLVYPVYYFSLPRNVEEFLGKVKLKADYLFCIQTYSTTPGDATDYMQHHAQKNNIHFDYVRSLRMPSNFLPYFDVLSEDNLNRAKDLPEHLQAAIADISAQKHWIEPVEMPEDRRRTEFKSPEILDRRSETLFTWDTGKCVRCGICTRVCPKGNFEIKGGITFSGECLYCLACANACPQKAITVNTADVNPQHRYRNPNVTVPQLIAANQQRAKK